MQHWHITLSGSEAPRVRHTNEPTWEGFGITTLGLTECTAPLVGGECSRMIEAGRVHVESRDGGGLACAISPASS